MAANILKLGCWPPSGHIQDICKIPGGGQAAAARPGPEPPGPDRGPRLGAGPGCRRLAAAWYFVYILCILYIFVYIWIYFGYILVYIFCIFFGMVTTQGPIWPKAI